MVKKEFNGRRGYKMCKNPECREYLHINQHVCQYCSFNNAQQSKNKISQTMNKKILTITKKNKTLNSSQIYTWKKYFLYKDDFNRQHNRDVELPSKISFSQIKVPQVSIKKLFPKTADLNYYSTQKTPQKLKLRAFEGTSLGDSPWTEHLFYFGGPVSSMAWLPGKKHQYLAVSLSLEDLSRFYTDDLDYLTIQTYQLQHLTKLGKTYTSAQGFIAIFELKSDNAFKPTLIQLCSTQGGTIQSLKFSYHADPLILGNLGCLKSTGKLDLYRFLNYSQFQEYEQIPYLEITISQHVLVSCFDWQGDSIVCGDQIGNTYLLLLKESSYEVQRVFPHSHSLFVSDIRFYPQGDGALWASCSYDGTFKIFELQENGPLFEQQFSTKKLTSILWDEGGKYVLVNKEVRSQCQGCSPSTIILSLFAAFKNQEKSIQISNKHETRQLDKNQFEHNLFQDSLIKFSGSYFSKYVFASDTQGNLFYYGQENLRKLAVKRIKNNKGKIRFFSQNVYDAQTDTFSLFSHQAGSNNQHSKQKAFFQNNSGPEGYKSQIRAMEVCPQDILSLSQGQTDTLLAFGDYHGFLRIVRIDAQF